MAYSTNLEQEEISPDSMADEEALFLQEVRSGYGKREVVAGVTMAVHRKDIIAIIGPNGSGKSTLLKTIFGLVKPWSGAIRFQQQACTGLKPRALIDRGLVYVPQGNRVFPDLTVRENLTVSVQNLPRLELRSRLDEMASVFPAVAKYMERPARVLSGGERQQVALAMGLIKRPYMLLLDEPSSGLAPALLADVFAGLRQINKDLGVTILVVEHKVREVFRISDYVFGLRRGQIAEEGPPPSFDDTRLKSLFLG